MNFDEDVIYYYDPRSIHELETESPYFECPYCRQRPPFQGPPSGPPQGSQGPHGRPPSGPPQGSQGPNGRPPSGPPSYTPSQSQAQHFGDSTNFAIDSGAIRPCVFRFVYIWPRRGQGFWAWLTFVGPRSVSGFRWNRNNWRFFGMDLREISSFECF